MKKISRKSRIRQDVTWGHNFNITMTSRIEVQPACGFSVFFYLFHSQVRVCEIAFSRPIIAQDKLFHRQNAVLNFLIPST